MITPPLSPWHRVVYCNMSVLQQRRRLAALGVLLVLLATAACGDGGDEPSQTRTSTSTPAPVGFLATATPEPSKYGRCGSGGACPRAGDRVNLYDELHLDRALALRLDRDASRRWVLERGRVQELLGMLDQEVTLETYAIPFSPGPTLKLLLPPTPHNSPREVGFAIDVAMQRMGGSIRDQAMQWQMPSGFYELVLESLSDATPTVIPEALVPTPFPTLHPPVSIDFDHPEGALRWDGPDDRVTSAPEGHCGNAGLQDEFGLPVVIAVGDEFGFWLESVVGPEPSWHWTGYYHDDWQLWQGDDPGSVYLLHTREQRVAFEYLAFLCI